LLHHFSFDRKHMAATATPTLLLLLLLLHGLLTRAAS
jgi:hypothetical protein